MSLKKDLCIVGIIAALTCAVYALGGDKSEPEKIVPVHDRHGRVVKRVYHGEQQYKLCQGENQYFVSTAAFTAAIGVSPSALEQQIADEENDAKYDRLAASMR